MRVFVCGDTHGDFDIGKLEKFARIVGDNLSKDDYLIICGDFGAVWYGDHRDKMILDGFYGSLPCTVLWVDGNHENFELLNEYSVEDWMGGKIHRVRENLFHLMRGEVFNLCGKKFFAFGGAKSVDRGYDTGDNKWWWREELPSEQEMDRAIVNLKKHDNVVDYVVTHNCPGSQIISLFGYLVYYPDALTSFLNVIAENVKFKHWFFGHHHQDITMGKFTCLYDTVREVKL